MWDMKRQGWNGVPLQPWMKRLYVNLIAQVLPGFPAALMRVKHPEGKLQISLKGDADLIKMMFNHFYVFLAHERWFLSQSPSSLPLSLSHTQSQGWQPPSGMCLTLHTSASNGVHQQPALSSERGGRGGCATVHCRVGLHAQATLFPHRDALLHQQSAGLQGDSECVYVCVCITYQQVEFEIREFF